MSETVNLIIHILYLIAAGADRVLPTEHLPGFGFLKLMDHTNNEGVALKKKAA